MKYFIDTEFLEGTQVSKCPFRYITGKRITKPTIDLISIALVGEDGREYYAISKDFNLKEAWNRFDIRKEWYSIDESTQSTRDIKIYWIRENVLKPIYDELCDKRSTYEKMYHWGLAEPFSYKSMKYLIDRYGKTNKQIAEEIKEFVAKEYLYKNGDTTTQWKDRGHPQFYGYFADYDWVVFCWLFGRMIDLPKGFPMYCIDLEQVLDERLKTYTSIELSKATCPSCKHNVYEAMDYKNPLITMQGCIKDHPNYPKQTNEHNALADARWNRELYKFIESLQKYYND
jgi:hypothetical protein